ncbi:MAG: hypothetical protein J7647_30310 [Cyanobacteria bacterium SBLK]|nr:hypothetical protein [Cyanobacteria bacterium SBLK]
MLGIHEQGFFQSDSEGDRRSLGFAALKILAWVRLLIARAICSAIANMAENGGAIAFCFYG